jgi:uncharacterized protein
MIFVDTSFWIALRVPRDTRHVEAQELGRVHQEEQWVTTNHVRGETWTWIRRKAGHRPAVGFLDILERSPRVQIAHVPHELEAEALRWLRRRDEREYSFVDATSFMLMKELRIRLALAFDGDFAAAGFVSKGSSETALPWGMDEGEVRTRRFRL